MQNFETLQKLVKSMLALYPHNMMVESGFSKMKFFESDYQANYNLQKHNSFRVISEIIDFELVIENLSRTSDWKQSCKIISAEIQALL